MAHHCPTCCLKCHCQGDIDDLILGENYACSHCEHDDNEDEEDWEVDDYWGDGEDIDWD